MKRSHLPINQIHPIFYALLNKQPNEVEKMIVKKPDDVNVRTKDGGKTPLHVATHRGDLAMVQMLLKNKADVSATTDAGFTALHVAAQNDQVDIIQCLVKAGANVNTATNVGCTPLHEAAANGCKKSCLTLIKLKANLEDKDFRYNLTPSNLAYQKGHFKLGELLIALMTYTACFIQDVNLVLFNWGNVFPDNTEEKQFIQQLSLKIKKLTDADEILNEVNNIFKSERFTKLVGLKQFGELLQISITKYQLNKAQKQQPAAKEAILPLLAAYQLNTQSSSNPADLIYDYYKAAPQ